VDAFVNYSTPLYKPFNPTAAKDSIDWTTYTGLWANVPYHTTGASGDYLATDVANQPSALKGDICRFLSHQPDIPDGDWVMPTLADFNTIVTNTNTNNAWIGTAPSSGTYWHKVGDSWSAKASNSTAGTYHEWDWGASYCENGTVFPASGRRLGGNGALNDIGTGGYYWSSSLYDASLAYSLGIGSDGVGINYLARELGFPVRCVLAH
jgi:hypothetical protein